MVDPRPSSLLLVEAVEKYIDENYMEPVTNASIAKHVHYSESWLKLCYMRVKGITPIQYLIDRRMLTAAQLLEEGNTVLKDIPFRVGYSSPSTFCASFKKHFGITMTDYRTAVQRERELLNGDVSKGS